MSDSSNNATTDTLQQPENVAVQESQRDDPWKVMPKDALPLSAKMNRSLDRAFCKENGIKVDSDDDDDEAEEEDVVDLTDNVDADIDLTDEFANSPYRDPKGFLIDRKELVAQGEEDDDEIAHQTLVMPPATNEHDGLLPPREQPLSTLIDDIGAHSNHLRAIDLRAPYETPAVLSATGGKFETDQDTKASIPSSTVAGGDTLAYPKSEVREDDDFASQVDEPGEDCTLSELISKPGIDDPSRKFMVVLPSHTGISPRGNESSLILAGAFCDLLWQDTITHDDEYDDEDDKKRKALTPGDECVSTMEQIAKEMKITSVVVAKYTPFLLARTTQGLTDKVYRRKKTEVLLELHHVRRSMDKRLFEARYAAARASIGGGATGPVDISAYGSTDLDSSNAVFSPELIARAREIKAYAASMDAQVPPLLPQNRIPATFATTTATTTTTGTATTSTTTAKTGTTGSSPAAKPAPRQRRIVGSYELPQHYRKSAQMYAAVIFLDDYTESDPQRKEPLLIWLRTFRTEEDFHEWINSSAGRYLRWYNVDCVCMYERLFPRMATTNDPAIIDKIPKRYQHPHLDNIMKARVRNHQQASQLRENAKLKGKPVHTIVAGEEPSSPADS